MKATVTYAVCEYLKNIKSSPIIDIAIAYVNIFNQKVAEYINNQKVSDYINSVDAGDYDNHHNTLPKSIINYYSLINSNCNLLDPDLCDNIMEDSAFDRYAKQILTGINDPEVNKMLCFVFDINTNKPNR